MDLPDYEEKWITVLWFGGKYEVSNHGNVRVKKTQKLVTVLNDDNGVPKVVLKKSGFTPAEIRVSDLVTQAFLGRKPSGTKLVHNDGFVNNNCIHNLNYVPITGEAMKNKSIKTRSLNGNYYKRN